MRGGRDIAVGALRPAVILYGEAHPYVDEITAAQTSDMEGRPDMLIIMGTSLEVVGFKQLVRDFARAVRATSCSAEWFLGSRV